MIPRYIKIKLCKLGRWTSSRGVRVTVIVPDLQCMALEMGSDFIMAQGLVKIQGQAMDLAARGSDVLRGRFKRR